MCANFVCHAAQINNRQRLVMISTRSIAPGAIATGRRGRKFKFIHNFFLRVALLTSFQALPTKKHWIARDVIPNRPDMTERHNKLVI